MFTIASTKIVQNQIYLFVRHVVGPLSCEKKQFRYMYWEIQSRLILIITLASTS
jgi:hypothetical protein